MTVNDFCDWIEDACGVQVCTETARSYLQSLSFNQESHHEAVDFYGYGLECDMVECCRLYRSCMNWQVMHFPSTYHGYIQMSQPFIWINWGDGTLNVLRRTYARQKWYRTLLKRLAPIICSMTTENVDCFLKQTLMGTFDEWWTHRPSWNGHQHIRE